MLRREAGADRPLNIDERYAQIADLIPGFGGMYIDESGTIVLALKPNTKTGPVLKAVRPLLDTKLYARSRRPISMKRFRVQEVKYNFRQLLDWKRSGNVLNYAQFGVHRLDLDERSNRISLGVHRGDQVGAVLAAMSGLGIPSDAVDVTVRPAMARLVTLENYSGAKKGGIRIMNSAYGQCSLGFNLYLTAGGSYRGFVTASHCTENQGGTEGTYFYQPTLSGPNQIGIEISDPQFTDTGVDCPNFSVCRYSDAALVSYDLGPTWAGAKIARTTFAGRYNGSDEISTTDPDLTVTDVGFPIVGAMVDKMGFTTGWTYGFVQSDCVDLTPAGTPSNYLLLCQYEADFGGTGGDSGAPVFLWDAGSNAEIAGILWGGAGGLAAFSGYADLRYELGHTPWQISGF